MVPKRDNMLEAFRKAGSDASKPSGAESAPPAEKPSRPPAPKPAKRSKPPRAARAGDSLGRIEGKLSAAGFSPPRTLPGVLVAAVLIAVAFATGVLVGRNSAVRAADPDAVAGAPGSPGAQALAPAGIVPGTRREPLPETRPAVSNEPRAPVSALMDPANEYTIAVVTYSATQEDLAFAAYDHLAAEGLPVFDPYLVGDNIVLLVGAAPRSEDLADLESRVRALSRNGARGVYSDAFRIRIDRYVER